MDLETQLVAKITSLESQLMAEKEGKRHEKELLEQKIVRHDVLYYTIEEDFSLV